MHSPRLLSFAALLHLSSAIPPPASCGVTVGNDVSRKTCTVTALGDQQDDVPNLLKAFAECGNGGDIIFPQDQNYWIAQKFNPVVRDVNIEWRGTFTFSDNITYWRQPQNTYPIYFQNHRTNFVLTGDGIRINGYGKGGIHGNGDTWYTAEAGVTQPGRPMPFVFWNVSDVTVTKFFVKQPALWSLNIMNGTNMVFDDIYCNATATQAPYGKNWVQNTDGFDTMDAHNVTLRNFIYQGGDDCIAIKPRSYDIVVQNATCRGGNGMAIGSLGQYLEDSSVENVTMSDVSIIRYNEDMHNAAYIKTWVGVLVNQSNYESDFQPRGGGTGVVRNITFENFNVQGADAGPAITQDSGGNGSSTVTGTSKMTVSEIMFRNFTGFLSGKSNKTSSFSCSRINPCFDIILDDVELHPSSNATGFGQSSCSNVKPGGIVGATGPGC